MFFPTQNVISGPQSLMEELHQIPTYFGFDEISHNFHDFFSETRSLLNHQLWSHQPPTKLETPTTSQTPPPPADF